MIKIVSMLLLLLLPSPALSQQCVPKDVYEIFIKEQFGMKLVSWAVDKDGSETIWLYMNDLKHFALIRVNLGGCSIVEIPEDQLSFFKENPKYYRDPSGTEPFMSQGDKM